MRLKWKVLIAAGTCLLASLSSNAGTPITVQLDWITNAQFAGVLVAKENGWVQKALDGFDPKTGKTTKVFYWTQLALKPAEDTTHSSSSYDETNTIH